MYTPTKEIDWGMILWSVLLSTAVLLCAARSMVEKESTLDKLYSSIDKLNAHYSADTENLEKKIRMMDKYYADMAKNTDKELEKVTAELNEVNHELEKAMSDREEMKREIDKVNTMLHEAMKLVYEVDHRVIKMEVTRSMLNEINIKEFKDEIECRVDGIVASYHSQQKEIDGIVLERKTAKDAFRSVGPLASRACPQSIKDPSEKAWTRTTRNVDAMV